MNVRDVTLTLVVTESVTDPGAVLELVGLHDAWPDVLVGVNVTAIGEARPATAAEADSMGEGDDDE